MKDFLWFVGISFVVLFIIFCLVWVSEGNYLFLMKVFSPKYEQVRKETFEQSKAYNQGMIQELQNMQFDYLKTKDEKAKEAMESIILHRVADYDVNKLPPDLYLFIKELRK